MASLITRRTAARQFLSAAKPPSSSSFPTGIPVSCRFQSTTPGYTPSTSTSTTTTAVPKPATYPSTTKPAYTPSIPSASTIKPAYTPSIPSATSPSTIKPAYTPSIPSATSPSTTKPAYTSSTPPATSPSTTKPAYTSSTPPATYPSTTKPAYTPAPKEANFAPTAADAFKSGLNDLPSTDLPEEGGIDWARSFSGLSREPFAKEIIDILMAPLQLSDIEVKPDGIIYLPEIKYRRILNLAFGPGGWGLAPRSDTIITNTAVTREYGLVCNARLVSVARGEQDYFDPSGIPTATEGCKSNALMRCCKDLGVASELWDPRFIRKFRKEMCVELMVEHMLSKKKKKMWFRKGDMVEFPFKQM
ncbi:putative mitochondrial genome maintenance protein Mgm101 [Tirmania nivea]|nr:putative mitochondrial genome maintenance protein Mgm101 [Tirmania nivea]